MDIPEELAPIVDRAVQSRPDSIPAAVEACMEAFELLPSKKPFLYCMLRQAFQDWVERRRSEINRRLKRDAGTYLTPGSPKGVSLTTARQIDMEYFDRYSIGNTVLGNILGADIPDLIEYYSGLARGHMLNVNLLKWLQPRVPLDRTVRQSGVKPGEVKEVIAKLQEDCAA